MAPRRRAADSEYSDYENKLELSPTARVADFLSWCADKFPGRPLPFNRLLLVANALPTLPRPESKEVELFRKNCTGRVKKTLMEKHSRGVLSIPGEGIRATTDSEDAMGFLEAKNRRLIGAIKGVKEARKIVEPKDIRNKYLKERLANIDKGLLGMPDLLKQLEMPKPDKQPL